MTNEEKKRAWEDMKSHHPELAQACRAINAQLGPIELLRYTSEAGAVVKAAGYEEEIPLKPPCRNAEAEFAKMREALARQP